MLGIAILLLAGFGCLLLGFGISRFSDFLWRLWVDGNLRVYKRRREEKEERGIDPSRVTMPPHQEVQKLEDMVTNPKFQEWMKGQMNGDCYGC